METIDLTEVAQVVEPDKRKLSFRQHGHLFTKVGFDVFQPSNSPFESYWILEKGEDGEEYLVANYGDSDVESLTATSSWEAFSDKEAKNVTLMYKGIPIKRLASSDYGFGSEDVHIFKSALVNKLEKDEEFVLKLMKEISEEKRNALAQSFPELSK